MDPKLLTYLIPVALAAFLIFRRSRGTRKIRPGLMWIRPAILAVGVGVILAASPMPGILAIGGFVAAAAAGTGIGYFAARHQKLSIHPETGVVSSEATLIGTAIVLGLFVVRFGAKLAFPQLQNPGHVTADVMAVTGTLMIFTVSFLIAQSVSLWMRVRPMLADHAAKKLAAATPDPAGPLSIPPAD